jgi:hypothetical protein
MVTRGDLFGGDQGCQLKPRLVDDLKKLIKQIGIAFGTRNQKQNALAHESKQADIQEQLQNVEKWQQPEPPCFFMLVLERAFNASDELAAL